MDFGALFDLDGVLVDSEGLYTEFWSGIEQLYPTGIPDYAHYIKGNTLTRILQNYDSPRVKDDICRRIHEYEDTMVYPLFPGVAEFLSSLRERGIPSAIVTSSDSVKMECLFRQHPELELMVDAVINGSMVERSKPDPQGYLMGAEAIGRRPEQCYVFEDSLQGLAAGLAAGATVIALATTNPREAITSKAHAVIDTFAGFTVDDMLSVSRL